jgi:hypothetical protein
MNLAVHCDLKHRVGGRPGYAVTRIGLGVRYQNMRRIVGAGGPVRQGCRVPDSSITVTVHQRSPMPAVYAYGEQKEKTIAD